MNGNANYTQAGHEQEDPSQSYADFDNPAGDPPATYPRPGNGPIRPKPITSSDDMHWMFDAGCRTFDHYYNDSSGDTDLANTADAEAVSEVKLIAIQGDRKGNWIPRLEQGVAAADAQPGKSS